MLPSSRRRGPRAAATLLATTAILAAPPALAGQAEDPRSGVAIEAGSRGYGLSVFAGTEIEEFDVEVLGLMKLPNPDIDFILARLTGKGLESSGVIAGMSGSPVYLGDELVGAVSFGWSFSKEAIAGIIPIASMRELSALPLVSAPAPMPAATIPVQDLLRPDFDPDTLERHLRGLLAGLHPESRSNLVWATVGFEPATRSLLERHLGAVAPAGSSPALEAELEGGSAVAGVLMDGDLQLAFTGTVTERNDDEILAFGHSFMGLGSLQLPMATAEVVTVLPSTNNSFKLANIGPVVGAFHQDRFAGMLGRIGAEAPTIPMHIDVEGSPKKTFDMRLSALPAMVPTLTATAIIQALESSRQLNGNQDVRLRTRIELQGHAPLELERTFAGNQATVSSAIWLLQLTAFMVMNSDEEVEIRSIDVDIEQASRPESVTLVGAHAERSTVQPGDRVTVHMDLREYRGDQFRRSIEVDVPDDLDSGTYYVFVGDGVSVDALRLQIQPSEPKDFRESMDLLRSQHSSRDFVVMGVVAGSGLVVEGRSLPDLPGSMRSIWAASGPLAAKKLNLAIRHETVEPLDRPLTGAARIDLRVRPRLD